MTNIEPIGGKYFQEFMDLVDSVERKIVSCKTSYAKILKNKFLLRKK